MPARNAPINADIPRGIAKTSMSDSLSTLVMVPITPAVIAIFTGLLNIIEKPNTPIKLITIWSAILRGRLMSIGWLDNKKPWKES